MQTNAQDSSSELIPDLRLVQDLSSKDVECIWLLSFPGSL